MGDWEEKKKFGVRTSGKDARIVSIWVIKKLENSPVEKLIVGAGRSERVERAVWRGRSDYLCVRDEF